MANTELVVAISSGTVFLIIIILAVMYFMKVDFMLKGVAWVRKLMGTSLKEQAGDKCGVSNVASYADDADELWDIIGGGTACPTVSTSTTTDTTPTTPTDIYTIISSNCSAYNIDFMKGVQATWTQTRLNEWSKFQPSQCPALTSYTFSLPEINWLNEQLKTCQNLVTAGFSPLQKYQTYVSSGHCTAPESTRDITVTGPAGRIFYSTTAPYSTLAFSSTDTTTVTYSYGSKTETGRYSYNSSDGTITFTSGTGITSPPQNVKYNSASSTLTVGTTQWLNTNPFTRLNGKTFYSPTTVGKKITFVSTTSLNFFATSSSPAILYTITMKINSTQGQIDFETPDPTTGISFITFSISDTITSVSVNNGTTNETWSTISTADILSVLNSLNSTTFYVPNTADYITLDKTNQGIAKFKTSGSSETQVTYTTEQTQNTQWTLRFTQNFSTTLGNVATFTYTGTTASFQMGSTVFATSTNTTPTSGPMYPPPPYEGFDVTAGSLPTVFSSTRLSDSPLAPYFYLTSVGQPGKVLRLYDKTLRTSDKVDGATYELFRIDKCGRFVCKYASDKLIVERATGNIGISDAPVPYPLCNASVWSYNRNTKQLKLSDGRCLQAGSSPEQNVSLTTCSETNQYQKWDITEAPIAIRLDSGNYNWLDDWDAAGTDVKIAAGDSTISANRVLQYDRFSGNLKFKTPKGGCLYPDFSNGQYNVKQGTCDLARLDPKFQWFFDSSNKRLVNMYNGGCLTAPSSAGQQVTTQQCDATNNAVQQWVADGYGTGTVFDYACNITNPGTGGSCVNADMNTAPTTPMTLTVTYLRDTYQVLNVSVGGGSYSTENYDNFTFKVDLPYELTYTISYNRTNSATGATSLGTATKSELKNGKKFDTRIRNAINGTYSSTFQPNTSYYFFVQYNGNTYASGTGSVGGTSINVTINVTRGSALGTSFTTTTLTFPPLDFQKLGLSILYNESNSIDTASLLSVVDTLTQGIVISKTNLGLKSNTLYYFFIGSYDSNNRYVVHAIATGTTPA